jgi:von Willebrand factor type A domain/Aerotolerance regulator N-terminal
MTFAGAPLSTLAPIFGVAAAAITALYILKLRRRRIEVPFARLWMRVLAERESSSLWRRLKRLISLMIQLAILALVVAAIGDPRAARGSGGRTIALLVDASASMRAADEAPTRFARAQKEAHRLVDGLGPGDAVLVMRLDGQPLALGGLETDDRELHRRIDAIEPSDTPADLDRGLRIAADLLRGQPHPTLILVGDGAWPRDVLDRVRLAAPAPDGGADLAAIDLAGVDLRYVPVGATGENVGIVGFSVRRYQANRASYEVFVAVRSYRTKPSPVKLELLQDGEVVDVQTLDLAPGATVEHFYPNLAGAGTRLEARIQPGDPFPVDDHAWALLPPIKKQKVQLVTSGNLFLEGALLLDENAAVDKIPPSAWDPAAQKGYDALVFDGFTPPEKPKIPAIYIDPSGPGSPFAIGGELRSPQITDTAAKHPLMRWVTLRDVNMARASRFVLAPADVALASSARDPIIVARDGAEKAVAIGFDVRKSDLPLRVAFPVLLVNALEWFAGDDASLQASFRTGRTFHVPASGDLLLRDPDGQSSRLAVIDGRAAFTPRKVGFYSMEGGPEARTLAASLADPAESAIQPAREITVAGRPLAAPEGFSPGLRRELWALLVFAALAIGLVEWWTYNRRVTV